MNLCLSCRHFQRNESGPRCGANAPAAQLVEARQPVRACASHQTAAGKTLIQERAPRG